MHQERRRTVVLTLCLAAGLAALHGPAAAEDWPHWRGPTFNGVVNSPPLVDAFAEGGPTKVWESEPLVVKGSDPPAGSGSVTIVDGRVYTFAHRRFKEPVEERSVPSWRPQREGYVPDMPKELSDAVETARLSDERNNISDRRAVETWVKEWLDRNVKEEHKKYREAAQARLRGGKKAVPLEILAKVHTIRDKVFPNQAAFDAWVKENGISEDVGKLLDTWLVKDKDVSNDVVCCLDAATGKTLWKQTLDSWWMWYAASSTPTVSGGRCYVFGSEAVVWCLDAKTGAVIWKSEGFGQAGNRHNRSSSPLVLEGVVVVASRRSTVGVDVQTGKILWTVNKAGTEYGSPVPWTAGGRTLAVIVASRKVFGIDPKTGELAWELAGGDGSTPTVLGDLMAVTGGKENGLVLYKMTPTGPEKQWNVAFEDDFTSPVIHDGYVYAFGEAYSKNGQGRGICVAAADGKVSWSRVVGRHQHSSPVVADGKLIAVGGPELYLVKADPGQYTQLGKANLRLDQWSSVSCVDGRVYLRTANSVICVDLRK